MKHRLESSLNKKISNGVLFVLKPLKKSAASSHQLYLSQMRSCSLSGISFFCRRHTHGHILYVRLQVGHIQFAFMVWLLFAISSVPHCEQKNLFLSLWPLCLWFSKDRGIGLWVISYLLMQFSMSSLSQHERQLGQMYHPLGHCLVSRESIKPLLQL